MENTELIRQAFKNLMENLQHDDNMYAAYFSEDYVQSVDGKIFNYQDFVSHMRSLKSLLLAVNIKFISLFGDGNKVSSIHIASGKKKNGQNFEVKVIAVFEIRDNKIISCDELTHSLTENNEDKHLGSVIK